MTRGTEAAVQVTTDWKNQGMGSREEIAKVQVD